MSTFKKDDDLALDAVERAAARIREDEVAPAVVESAAARVWERLAVEARRGPQAQAAAPADAPSTLALIRGCDDFKSLIPAYLAGQLPPARALLVEDHTRSCVTCRRALKDAREGAAARAATPRKRTVATPFSARARSLWMGLAAALLFTLGLSGWVIYQDLFVRSADVARIESIEGGLFLVDGETARPIGAGEQIDEGEEVRTAKGSQAFVRLADGSLVELAERAQMSVETASDGTTVNLSRGNVIVQAAKQRDGHLYVQTPDCLVSVTGTIFAVNRGTKGSRVSVVEGEVRVEQSSKDSILHPGDQVTTHASVEAVPVAREVAWSANAPRYRELLTELTALGRDVDAQVARPGLRTSTALLDLAPADTMIWVGLPNLAESMGATQRLLEERLGESEVLRQWWQETMGSPKSQERFRELVEEMERFGSYLGNELAVAVSEDRPVLLAEVEDAAGLSAFLAQEAASLADRHGEQVLYVVADPADIGGGGGMGDGIYVWVGERLLVASPEPALITEMAGHAAAGTSPFAATVFHAKVAQAYEDGTGYLFAANLERLVGEELVGDKAAEPGSSSRQTAESLGILDLEHFIVEGREAEGRTQAQAALTFSQARRGLASWLAAPAPMGSLQFFSPNANVVAAFVVRDPVQVLDEVLAATPDLAAELEELRAEQGIDVREDLARPLGGEVAMGIDGPLLPKPSTKVVVEVYDPARLQATLERALERINAEQRRRGEPEATLTSTADGGRTYHALRFPASEGEAHWAFVEGYLVMTPSRALLDQAIQYRESGTTIASAAKFRQLLPHDGEINFSALVYYDVGSVTGPLAGAIGRLEEGRANGNGPQPQIAGLLAGATPTLVYAYGEEDRILFASSSEKSPIGLNLKLLTGFGSIMSGLGEEDVEAESATVERSGDVVAEGR